MAKPAGKYVQLNLTDAEADTMALVLQACLECEADPERLMPLLKRLNVARARKRMRAMGGEGDAVEALENGVA